MWESGLRSAEGGRRASRLELAFSFLGAAGAPGGQPAAGPCVPLHFLRNSLDQPADNPNPLELREVSVCQAGSGAMTQSASGTSRLSRP